MALTMRVKLNPEKPAMVIDADAMDREPAVRRFIGAKALGDKFVSTDEEATVSFRKEHLDAVKEGHLIPCDEATATLCGVPFVAPKSAVKAAKGSE
jgi:hypothetical protein